MSRLSQFSPRGALLTGCATCALACLVLALPASAGATGVPGAYTGAAVDVSYGSATLRGVIAPRGSATTYYFQYGPTTAYGSQTPVGSVAPGNSVDVSVAISGLAPLTVYHYRLIAVNAVSAATGASKAFKTAKVPLSLQILVSPNPTLYGSSATVQGTLSGTGNAGRAVVLQENPFPYTAGFANVGNAELTTSTGSFSFLAPGLTQATQFRVVTTTNPPVLSPVATEGVAVQVSAHVAATRRRHYARIYGTVTPAIDGMEVGFMRVIGGRNVLVSGTVLRHKNAASSSFSRTIRVHQHALYRVLVRVTNGAQVSNYSSPLFIR